MSAHPRTGAVKSTGAESAKGIGLLLQRSSPQPLSEGQPERGAAPKGPADAVTPTPDELNPKRLRRRLLELGAVSMVVGLAVLTGPGLDGLRRDVERASPGWLVLGVGLEALSALSYVVVFRAVFCPRMSWRLSYQFGLSEQGANSVLSVSGAGGLALGAWALSRGGMSAEQIGRKSVALFFLTSLPNVAGVMAFAALYATGALGQDLDPTVTYGFGAGALVATVSVLALPRLLPPTGRAPTPAETRRIAAVSGSCAPRLGKGSGTPYCSLGAVRPESWWVRWERLLLTWRSSVCASLPSATGRRSVCSCSDI